MHIVSCKLPAYFRPQTSFRSIKCYYVLTQVICTQVMIHLGVTRIPNEYILRRWTPNAEINPSTLNPATPHGEMPEESRKKMKYAVYCNELTSLAKVACQSDDGQRILSMHIKQLKTELSALKKRQQRANAAAQSTGPSRTRGPSVSVQKSTVQPARTAPTQTSNAGARNTTSHAKETVCPTGSTIVLDTVQDRHADTAAPASSAAIVLHDPPMSNTKGRKKAKAFQNPLDIQVKVKRKCKVCGSDRHDARNCPERNKTA